MPAIVVFTKFDEIVSQVHFDSSSSELQAQARAYTLCEESCRRIFHKEPIDVPVQIVSGIYTFFSILLEKPTDNCDHLQRNQDSSISSTI